MAEAESLQPVYMKMANSIKWASVNWTPLLTAIFRLSSGEMSVANHLLVCLSLSLTPLSPTSLPSTSLSPKFSSPSLSPTICHHHHGHQHHCHPHHCHQNCHHHHCHQLCYHHHHGHHHCWHIIHHSSSFSFLSGFCQLCVNFQYAMTRNNLVNFSSLGDVQYDYEQAGQVRVKLIKLYEVVDVIR